MSFYKRWTESLPAMDWRREEPVDDLTKVRFKFTLNIAHNVVLESLTVLKRRPKGKAWTVQQEWTWSEATKEPPYQPSSDTVLSVVDAFRKQIIYNNDHLEVECSSRGFRPPAGI